MFVVFLFMGSFFGFRGTNKQFLLTVPPPLWDFFDRAEIGIFEKKCFVTFLVPEINE
jgi:hypothetical protein